MLLVDEPLIVHGERNGTLQTVTVGPVKFVCVSNLTRVYREYKKTIFMTH